MEHLFKIEDFGFSGFWAHNKANIDESNGAKIIGQGELFSIFDLRKIYDKCSFHPQNLEFWKSNDQSIDMV